MKGTEVALLTVIITAVILVIVVVTVLCTTETSCTKECYSNQSSLLSEIAVSADFPVDYVYTWVDGGDTEWRAVREKAFTNADKKFNTAERLPTTKRKGERDELYYSLRLTLKHLPFLRNIFIVTQRPQVPSYIAEMTPEVLGFPFQTKIIVVHHDEFFDHDIQQPTFNSMVIESQIANIAELADHYIYSNDDCFILKPMARSDFFTPEGAPRLALEMPYWLFKENTPWDQTLKRTMTLTQQLGSSKPFGITAHVQQPLFKPRSRKLASALKAEILKMQQFRGPNDFVIQYIELNAADLQPPNPKIKALMFQTSQGFLQAVAAQSNLVQVCINGDFNDAARRKLDDIFHNK